MSFMIIEWKVWAAIVTVLFSPISPSPSVRETIQRVSYRHLAKEKDKIVIQFWGRVKFRWNLNGAVFWWTQNKAELNVHRVKNWSHCRVDPESCCLGNYKVSIYVEHCVQKPLLWNSAPGLEIKLVSLCQGDLDPPGKSGCFVLQIYFKTAKFLMSMILDNKNSQWVRIQ